MASQSRKRANAQRGGMRPFPCSGLQFSLKGPLMSSIALSPAAPPLTGKALTQSLYVQVLVAIALGAMLGVFFPDAAASDWVKALGDGFIKLIKMAITPVIFCTIASGIAHIEDARKVGRIGLKALVYFEIMSTFALAIGLLVGNLLRPGEGFLLVGAMPGPSVPAAPSHRSGPEFFLDVIPESAIGAFAKGDVLQVLVFALLFGFSLLALGERGHGVRNLVDETGHVIFGVIAIVMKAAPLGAFAAMAYTVGKFGSSAMLSLAWLVGSLYVTAFLFVALVLGAVARLAGFSIFRLISYIKDEIFLVLGTSSSESALPQLMEKLERLGCSKSVVGLVVPAGYSFNLDGTCIYLTLATMFIAQALGVDLSFTQQATIFMVAMLASKGASAVTGSAFVTLAATLAAVDPRLAPGMAIIFGVDKFLGECRAVTNIVGNGVATLVIAWWVGELDRTKLAAGLVNKANASGD
jgi:aerobic C4-dicarboxylate transport protein